MLVNNHDDACWIIMMMMLVNYICICAYMLLVNFLTCKCWWKCWWNACTFIAVEIVVDYSLWYFRWI